jgi:hypothetical protein
VLYLLTIIINLKTLYNFNEFKGRKIAFKLYAYITFNLIPEKIIFKFGGKNIKVTIHSKNNHIINPEENKLS